MQCLGIAADDVNSNAVGIDDIVHDAGDRFFIDPVQRVVVDSVVADAAGFQAVDARHIAPDNVIAKRVVSFQVNPDSAVGAISAGLPIDGISVDGFTAEGGVDAIDGIVVEDISQSQRKVGVADDGLPTSTVGDVKPDLVSRRFAVGDSCRS